MKQPMDAQGGENIDLLMSLYRALAEDAAARGQRRHDYYFLDHRILETFKRFQELPKSVSFPGTPVEQAYWIWRQTPRATLSAVLRANGIDFPCALIQIPEITTLSGRTKLVAHRRQITNS